MPVCHLTLGPTLNCYVKTVLQKAPLCVVPVLVLYACHYKLHKAHDAAAVPAASRTPAAACEPSSSVPLLHACTVLSPDSKLPLLF